MVFNLFVMKRVLFRLLVGSFVFSQLVSCSSRFYQIATVSSNDLALKDDCYVSKYDDFTVTYDFWSESGRFSFVVTNNSDDDIMLDFGRSYFVNNGYAYDYYQGRTFVSERRNVASYNSTSVRQTVSSGASLVSYDSGSYSSSSSVGVAMGNNVTLVDDSGYSVEYKEAKVVCIPAHSSKIFRGFAIMPDPYRECGLPRFPVGKEVSVKEFSEYDTPCFFENRLVFVVDGESVPVNHTFFVSRVQNYDERSVFKAVYPVMCNGKRSANPVMVPQVSSSDKFFIRYAEDYNGVNDSDRLR